MLDRCTDWFRGILRTVAVAAAVLAAPSLGSAEVLGISSADFHPRCPCANNPDGVFVRDDAEFKNGVLTPTGGATYYASVPFPENGDKVCKFTLIYQDKNANNFMRARLLRKDITPGTPAYKKPVKMAEVVTEAGAVNTIRQTSTRNIKRPVISQANALYYVEVFIEEFNINLIGVSIDYRDSCPAPG